MKKLVLVAAASASLVLSGCASGPPEAEVKEACIKELRFEIENNVPGTVEEWLAYEMSTEMDLVKSETYEGGAAYTFNGVATLTADDFPTKTVDFTCFGNDRPDMDYAGASIHTINGECTNSRQEDGYCG